MRRIRSQSARPPGCRGASANSPSSGRRRGRLLVKSRAETLAWLSQRIKRGVAGESYRVRGFDLREGDWLMMRNPSPYNLFTDMSPGLFTHVGIVSAVTGEDGVRRFVIVDLPERSEKPDPSLIRLVPDPKRIA